MSVRVHESAKPKGNSHAHPRKRKGSPTDGRTDRPDGLDLGQMAKAQIAARESARQEAVAREAYYRAERRGFAPGYELDDWLSAEAQVDGNGPIEIPGSVDDPVDERHRAPDVTPVR